MGSAPRDCFQCTKPYENDCVFSLSNEKHKQNYDVFFSTPSTNAWFPALAATISSRDRLTIAALLSPELVAGIRRVKGIKRLGQPVGNWLTAQQGRQLLSSEGETLRGKRDRAMLALLLGCGLRRSELVTLKSDQIQQREDHWVIVDLVGKSRHIRQCRYRGGSKRI